MNYIFSPANNAFYNTSMKSLYDSAGTWPHDGIKVTNNVFNEFTQSAPEGKVRAASDDGLPVWVDIPAPSKEQMIEVANAELASRRAAADQAILPLQDAIDLGIATEKEIIALQDWKKYRVALNRLDIASSPDFEWPDEPE